MSLFDIFNSNDAQKASKQQIAGLKQGQKQATSDIQTGLQGDVSALQQGQQLFQPLYSTDVSGANAYADATGANGAEGYARALQSFQSSPLYQSMFGANGQAGLAEQAIDRNRAAQGMLASGNTDADIANYITQTALPQTWNTYTSNLSPYNTLAQSSAGSMADILSKIGSAKMTTGENLAGLDQQTAAAIGANKAGATMANQTASANQWNALLAGASLLAAK